MVCKFKMGHPEGIMSLKLAIHMMIVDMSICAEEEAIL
jgi:hypothetical protein